MMRASRRARGVPMADATRQRHDVGMGRAGSRRHRRGWCRTNRWKLRRAAGLVNQVLGSLRLEKHPDKTFIGRIERGFDFLGYHFTPGRLSLATGTLVNFADKISRLYEQGWEGPEYPSPLGAYVRRWCAWAGGGLAAVQPGLTLMLPSGCDYPGSLVQGRLSPAPDDPEPGQSYTQGGR